MRRPVLVGIAAMVLVWTLPPAGSTAAVIQPGGTFYDDDQNTHERSIEAIAALGITHGCNPPLNDRFCPFRAVTRGEMAAFLVRALGLDDDGGGDLFVDDDLSVFRHDIDKLAAAGITYGCNPPLNDRFCPFRAVTRAETATFLARALGLATPPVPSRTTTWSNSNPVQALAFDAAGDLWAVGPGGAVRWDVARGTAEHFTVDDGLAANAVNDVAVALDGSVWFATSSGVSRFDGVRWTKWRWPGLEASLEGLPTHAHVGSIAVAPNGDVWAGFSWLSSVARFDGVRWKIFTQEDGLGSGPVMDIAVRPDGVVYVTTESGCCEVETHGGLSVFDGSEWRVYEVPFEVPGDLYSIAFATDGSAWFGGCDAVYRFDGTEFATYEVDAQPCFGVGITVAANGDVLVATPSDGLGRFDGSEWTLQLPPRGWLAGTSVVERNGVVWVGGWYDLWKVEGGTWARYVRDNQPPLRLEDAARDRNGVLWVAAGDAAYSFDGIDWVRHEQLAGFDVSRLTVAEAAPNGDLWLGPFRYDGTTWTNHTEGVHFDVGAPSTVIDIAFGPDGSVWFAGEYGVVSYVDGTFRAEGGVPVGETLGSIAAGFGGEGWAVAGGCIYRLGDDRWERVEDLDGHPVTGATAAANGSDGNVWFALDDAVAMTDGSSWTILQGEQAAPVYGSWSIAVDDEGRLWATGHGGIHVYDGIGWTVINTADGLPSDGVWRISVDADGTLSITSGSAVTRYQR